MAMYIEEGSFPCGSTIPYPIFSLLLIPLSVKTMMYILLHLWGKGTQKERHKHKDKKKKKKKEKEKEKEKAGDLNGEAHGKFALDLVSLSFLLLPPSLPPSFHPKNTAVGLLQNLECPVKRFKVYYGPPTIIRLSL